MTTIRMRNCFVAYGLLVSGACYLMSSRARAQVRDDLVNALETRVDVLMYRIGEFRDLHADFQLYRITGNPSALRL